MSKVYHAHVWARPLLYFLQDVTFFITYHKAQFFEDSGDLLEPLYIHISVLILYHTLNFLLLEYNNGYIIHPLVICAPPYQIICSYDFIFS